MPLQASHCELSSDFSTECPNYVPPDPHYVPTYLPSYASPDFPNPPPYNPQEPSLLPPYTPPIPPNCPLPLVDVRPAFPGFCKYCERNYQAADRFGDDERTFLEMYLKKSGTYAKMTEKFKKWGWILFEDVDTGEVTATYDPKLDENSKRKIEELLEKKRREEWARMTLGEKLWDFVRRHKK